jgi:asparagine N-glycosylation enzyme membrane subunit Stt3
VALLKEPPKIGIKKKYGLERVGKEFSGIAVFLIFLMLMVNLAFPMPRVYTQAYTPTTISSGSLSVSPQYLSTPVREWIDMLHYMRTTLSPTTVVCSWWDYGYWMTVLGNVTSLADNATVNGTQIENIGFIFMANETQAMKMLKLYNASYILVYTTIRADTGEWINAGGDEGKWIWMTAISGKARERFINDGFISADEMWNETINYIRDLFGNYTLGTNWIDTDKDGQADQSELQPNFRGQNATIYKLMRYAVESWKQKHGKGGSTIELIYLTPEFIAGLDNDGSKYGGVVPLVCLYKINWDKYYRDQPSG